MNKEEIIGELDSLIKEAKSISDKKIYTNIYGVIFVSIPMYTAFLTKVITFFYRILANKDDINICQINNLLSQPNSLANFNKVIVILTNIREYVEKGYIELKKYNNYNIDTITILENIFRNFHKMAIKLKDRYDNRATLDINDEYDVQDLLYAALQLFFEDVRKEEWTPSYAGNSSRVDFLLKDKNIIIEVKKTRKSMSDKELGEQLIIDIAKYKVHPNCKMLICFIYDPDVRIVNPKGIKNDLEKDNGDFIKVFICP